MAIGERIHFFRTMRGMTQKYLGMALGFPEKSADVRLAQYENGSRTPKADVTAALAQALDVSPKALDVPDIDSYVGLMHTLFTLEDRYGLEVCECEDEVHLRVHIHKGRDAAELHRMLTAWGAVVAKLKAGEITKEEYPYPGRPVAAADVHSAGVKEHYDVVYGWPGDDEKEDKPEQCIFTREFGENVDDWYAHNNNNRASRSWGERPLLVQAMSLAKSYDEMYRTTGLFIGGAQWHPFDHQRGYHPDPYWGGIYDAFRQKKYAYEVFRSQSPASLQHPLAECGPMIFIAHEMSQFSDKDVVVFTNCDSVRLSIYDGTKTWTKPVVHAKGHMPNAPVIFENVWDFWEARGYSYTQKNWQKVNMVAEGIIDGKVVCTQKEMPSRRSTKLRLYVDTQKVNLIADGSDFIVVVAEVTDDSGNVRRLAKDNIVFTVEGEGEIIGDATIGANPRAVEFGSAPVLIRSTRKAGKIKVKARVQFEGTQAPTATEIELESVPAEFPFCYEEQTYEIQRTTPSTLNATPVKGSSEGKVQLTEEERQRVLDEVERQQTEFGTEK